MRKDQRGLVIRPIGLVRARTKSGLAKLTYDVDRFIRFERRAAIARRRKIPP